MEEIDINPLDVLGARRLNFLPPHFEPVSISVKNWGYELNAIPTWIEKNLKGRYYYGSITELTDNTISVHKVVSFEESTELTVFLLKCPYIGQN